MPAPRINYLMVFVSAIVVFVIGFIWYSLLFQRQWVQAHGFTQDQLDAMKTTVGKVYGISFVCILVMGAILAVLIDRTGALGARAGAQLGGLIWLGFAATIGLMASLYTGAPFMLYLLDAGYQLVYLLAMGAILGWARGRAGAAA